RPRCRSQQVLEVQQLGQFYIRARPEPVYPFTHMLQSLSVDVFGVVDEQITKALIDGGKLFGHIAQDIDAFAQVVEAF
ncbi:hypothetical protein ACQJ0H_23225, partial [Pantoea agglomerans]|uniref:hypothetical protein n=1 Tax=Enterobacter agglomerans TaxID=549 RepID=UPI003CE7863A